MAPPPCEVAEFQTTGRQERQPSTEQRSLRQTEIFVCDSSEGLELYALARLPDSGARRPERLAFAKKKRTRSAAPQLPGFVSQSTQRLQPIVPPERPEGFNRSLQPPNMIFERRLHGIQPMRSAQKIFEIVV